jgi:hypothetical protein
MREIKSVRQQEERKRSHSQGSSRPSMYLLSPDRAWKKRKGILHPAGMCNTIIKLDVKYSINRNISTDE